MGYRRVIVLVLDGLGVGSAPDAAQFGDAGSDTLAHIAAAVSLDCPSLASLGLGNLYPAGLPGLPVVDKPRADFGRLTELSAGKDSTTGHWEMMGIVREHPAPSSPMASQWEVLADFSRRTGRGVLGNKAASGTAIVAELGAEHVRTGDWIVYTSGDSVFQIAAQTDVIPLTELYSGCEAARAIMQGPQLGVDRVIARPFIGTPEVGFTRTPDRKDFSLEPPEPTVLDRLKAAGQEVIGVGKISDLFAGRGLTADYPVHGNAETMRVTAEVAADPAWRGLLFVNLVDFDMQYGHRNDAAGYAAALVEFDRWLGPFLAARAADELVMLTSDHGNDPTTASTDHSREQVPWLVWSRGIESRGGQVLDLPPGFDQLGKAVETAIL